MPAAHSTLWFLGICLGLWGVTLIVRGIPHGLPDFLRRRGWPKASAPGRQPAQSNWRLVLGGVAAIASGVGSAVLGASIYRWTHSGSDFMVPVWPASALAVATFSMTLLIWALRGEGTAKPRCPRCRYSMVGGGLACPECGFAASASADFFRPIRRKRTAAFAVLLFIVSPSLLLAPNYQRYGTMGLVPTTMLIAGFDWLPDPAIGRVEDWGTRRPAYVPGAWKGSLGERFAQEVSWQWQDRWLSGKAKRLLLQPSSSDRTILRSWRFAGHQLTSEEQEAAIARLFKIFCTGDQKNRETVATKTYLPLMLMQGHDYREIMMPHAAELRSMLNDPDPAVAMTAASLLVSHPEHAGPALAGAIQHLGTRTLAGVFANATRRIAAQSKAGRTTLLEMAGDPDARVRLLAIQSFTHAGLLCDRVKDQMVRSLSDTDLTVAVFAADVLRRHCGQECAKDVIRAARARPPIEGAEMLKHVEPDSLSESASELGEILAAGIAPIDLAALELLILMQADGLDISPALEAIRAAAGSADQNINLRASTLLDTINVNEHR